MLLNHSMLNVFPGEFSCGAYVMDSSGANASRATRNVIITSSSLPHSPCLPLGTQRRRPSSSLEAVRTMTCARHRRRDTGWNLSTVQNLHKRARGQGQIAVYRRPQIQLGPAALAACKLSLRSFGPRASSGGVGRYANVCRARTPDSTTPGPSSRCVFASTHITNMSILGDRYVRM